MQKQKSEFKGSQLFQSKYGWTGRHIYKIPSISQAKTWATFILDSEREIINVKLMPFRI